MKQLNVASTSPMWYVVVGSWMPVRPTTSDPLSMDPTLTSMSHRLAMNMKLRKIIVMPDFALEEDSAIVLVLTFCPPFKLPCPEISLLYVNK
jgi:hypothetical protein